MRSDWSVRRFAGLWAGLTLPSLTAVVGGIGIFNRLNRHVICHGLIGLCR